MTTITDEFIRDLEAEPSRVTELGEADFEKLVSYLLAGLGDEVTLAARSQKIAADVLATSREPTGDETVTAIQIKQSIRPEHVAQMASFIRGGHANRAILIARQTLREPTRLEAQKYNELITLADDSILRKWIEKYIEILDRRAPSLSLYFDLSEFNEEDIGRILDQLSSVYSGCGGDKLIIDDVTLLNPVDVPEPVGA